MATVRLSKKYTLQIGDWLRSAYMVVAPALLVYVYDWASGDTEFNLKQFVKMGIATGASYLIKNGALEPAKTIVTADTNQKAVNATEKIKDVVTQP